MSMKIYNGYQINEKLSAYSLMHLMVKISKDCKEICQQLYHHEIAKFASLCLDTKFILGADKMNDEVYSIYKYRPSKSTHDLFFYIQELVEQHSNSKSILQDSFDFKCQVKLIPIKEKTLFLLYTEKQEYKDLFGYIDSDGIEHSSKTYPNISPYIYYNNTDKPMNISENEWNIRRKEWDKALKNNENGFIYTLTATPFFYNVEVVIDEIETMYEERIDRLAYNKAREIFYKENKHLIDKNDFNKYLTAFIDYSKSNTYKHDLELLREEIKKKLPKRYMKEDLKGLNLKSE